MSTLENQDMLIIWREFFFEFGSTLCREFSDMELGA